MTDTFTPPVYQCGCPPGVYAAKTVRYTIGGALDFHIIGPFRGEVDALYQPFSFDHFGIDNVDFADYSGSTKGSLWQFPVLAKYRVPVPLLKPFVDIGPSVQLATNIHGQTTIVPTFPPGPAQVVSVHQSPNAVPGLAVGGGIEFHLGPLVLVPEVRYAHWFDFNFTFAQSNSGTRLNQAQVLLSIRV